MGAAGGPGGLTAGPPPGRLVRHVAGVLARGAAAVPEGATVLVGVSGGPDSVALLHLVVAARPDLAVVVAHVRHGLRDDAPDAAAARANAAALGLPAVERDVAVGAGRGPEDAARIARWTALLEVAADVGAAAVLVGHTMDDQAETVLLRLARGTGVAGLGGMAVAATRGGTRVLRPLLGLRRAEVRAAADGHPWVEDPTNADADQRRARARAEALPALSRLHPSEADVVPVLARLADLARRESDALDALVTPIGRYGPARVVVRGPTALTARALHRAIGELLGGRPPPLAAVEAALALPPGRARDVEGGVVVTAAAGGWVVRPRAAPVADLPLPTGVPVPLPHPDLVLRAEVALASATPGPADPVAPPPWTLHLDAPGPLVVGWRGPDGARDARRALARVHPGLRALVPLVRDADGRLVAVGARAIVPARPGDRCTRLVGYPPPP